MRNNRISFVRSEAFRIAWLNETTSCSNAEMLPFVPLSKEDSLFRVSPTWCGCDGYIGDEKAFVARLLVPRRIGFRRKAPRAETNRYSPLVSDETDESAPPPLNLGARAAVATNRYSSQSPSCLDE
jgi:hypothetical protein